MGPLELGARGRRGSRRELRRWRSPRLRIAMCVRYRRARAPRLRVCLGLSTCVSATIITPEVWARPCTRLSFVRGGAMPPGNARWHVSPPPCPARAAESVSDARRRGGGRCTPCRLCTPLARIKVPGGVRFFYFFLGREKKIKSSNLSTPFSQKKCAKCARCAVRCLPPLFVP